MKHHLLKTLTAVLAIVAAAAGPVRAQSNHTKYTSEVAMSALQVGDTLAEGFSLTGEDANFIYLVQNRHKHNENLSVYLENISLDQVQSIGANCVFSTLVNEQSITFAPVDENGRDGDAWVVTEVESIAIFTNITIAGIRIPGPPHTVRLAAGTEEAANWTLASGNASVPGTQVLENVMSGSELTATYSGTRKVKSVKAVKYIAPWDGNLAHIPSSALEADGKTVIVPNGMTLYGTLGQNYKIAIATGDTMTLDNATIIGENDQDFPWAGINCLGDATIILKDETTNSVKGFNEEYPGIHVPSGSTLTLQGTGALTATSNGWAAGIGGGYNISCGNIHIKGGTITATGGNTAAAIGGGRYACGDITISGGTVNATGGSYASGIGGGYRDLCGNITITTGVTLLTATKGNDAPNSIGAGDEGACGTVTVGDREYYNGITKSPYTYPEPIVLVTSITLNKSVSTLAVGAFEILSVTTVVPDSATDQSVSWNSSDESKATVDQNGRVTAVAAGTALIIATTNDGSDVKDTCTMTVVEPVTWDGNLSMIPVTALEADGVTLFVPNGMTLTDTLNADYKITIAAGDTVILDNAVIIGENDENYPWAGITCLGDATIILKDGSTNSVTGFYEGYPGIHIASGGTLTLQGETAGTGALTVTCNGWAAAIGGGYEDLHCGNIHIKGGVITANGRGCAAAIGGGRTSDCGNITISGGTVNANGGSVAAAIGGGQLSNCGDITITTGVTRVTATMGTDATYSIGKGVGSNVTCGTITIGGTVYPDGITQSPYTYPEP